VQIAKIGVNTDFSDARQSRAARERVSESEAKECSEMVKKLTKFNCDKATAYAAEKAEHISVGRCAKYVRQALNAGGAGLESGPDAWGYAELLPALGFAAAMPPSGFKNGDVMVFDRGRFEYGHVQIFCANLDGGRWVSDFLQRKIGEGHRSDVLHLPGASWQYVHFTLWRWPGIA
jgi:hypothetical protein